MIKAIITDVDGVLAGSLRGVNFPNPHVDVIAAMKRIHKSGIPIILCTGNYYYSKLPIMKAAELANPHITDNGALVIDPLNDKVISKHGFLKDDGVELIKSLVKEGIYIEVYTDHQYFLQNDQKQPLTEKRKVILQQDPVFVESLAEIAAGEDIIKVNAFLKNEAEKQAARDILEKLEKTVHGSWTLNPSLPEWNIINITANGISKKFGAIEAITYLGLSFDDVLGIGDTVTDWDFIELCGYGAAMGNGEEKLKELVKSKGPGRFMIAPGVDENGVLEVWREFGV